MSVPVAVPRLYQTWAFALHTPFGDREIALLRQGLTVEREGCFVRVRGVCSEQALRSFLGPSGERLLRALYSIANDEPFWRSADLNVSANRLLDAFGFVRSRDGYHYSHSRRRMVLLLKALAAVEVAFPQREFTPLAFLTAPSRALPTDLSIKLALYEGVRSHPARLGNDYVLVPRLAPLGRGRPSSTGALSGYLLARQRQLGRSDFSLRVDLLLRRAGIDTARPARARTRLREVLVRLAKDGLLLDFALRGEGRTAVYRLQLRAPLASTLARPRARAYGG